MNTEGTSPSWEYSLRIRLIALTGSPKWAKPSSAKVSLSVPAARVRTKPWRLRGSVRRFHSFQESATMRSQKWLARCGLRRA